MIIDDLNDLTERHMLNCKAYGDFVRSMYPAGKAADLGGVPFLPVRAFKEFALKSIPDDQVYKTMRSSGTSGQYSQIFLDRETAQKQTRALVDIFTDAFGKGRFPMLVIDTESTVKDRLKFSARTAAINGFSMFSRERCFALDNDMAPDYGRIRAFLEQNREKRIFVFGFTFLIWNTLVKKLRRTGERLTLDNAFILHGGGWKKLEAEKVSNDMFKAALNQTTGCTNVRNYYGMVEQTGTIFMECEAGRMHASAQASALIRDPQTHAVCEHGQTGLIQVFSTIQDSYPGHSLLTEDVGRTYAGESCSCGHSGIIVEIDGRLARAGVRGCSDAYT